MKNLALFVCVCIIGIFLMDSCLHAETHTHNYDWYANADSHWQKCSCGAQTKMTPHDLTRDSHCYVCSSTVYRNGDGSFTVHGYNDRGSIVRKASYDASGRRISEQRSDIQYYDDGNIKSIMEYEDDILVSEKHYRPHVDIINGQVYLAESITYYPDGEKEVVFYNEDGRPMSVTYYDAMGAITSVERYEYEYDSQGNCIKQTTYVNGVLYREVFYTTDAEGYLYEYKQIYYNEKGEIVEEYNFDASDNIK